MLRSVLFVTFFILSLTSGQLMPEVNDYLFSGGFEFLDLSHSFNDSTVYWPGGKKFTFTKKVASTRPDGVWYSANEFCAAEHGGTHLDAPRHLDPQAWTVGEIPFENLITPLTIVDLSKVVAGNNDFVLQRHHMDFLPIQSIKSKRNFTVIFRFGWSQYYSNRTKYLGSSTPNADNLNFPGISEDVAKWLTENKNIVGVGVDTASVDPGSEKQLLAHTVLARKNIFMLENVNIEKDLPSIKCAIIVMPMKIYAGTGAPCRLTAICPKTTAESFF